MIGEEVEIRREKRDRERHERRKKLVAWHFVGTAIGLSVYLAIILVAIYAFFYIGTSFGVF